MRLSRAERSLLVDWWFTVDRALLAAVLVIIGAGLLVSLAASPSIAIKRGLPTFHFVERHAAFALASVIILLTVSFLSPARVRRLAAVALLRSARSWGWPWCSRSAPKLTVPGAGCSSAATPCSPPSSPSQLSWCSQRGCWRRASGAPICRP